MKACALLFSNTLIGQEIRERLVERRDLCGELRLLTLEEEDVGALTEFRGAAVVQRLESPILDDVDLLIVAGWSPEVSRVLDERPPSCRVVLIDPGADHGGVEVIDMINLDDAVGADVVISPHPAAVLLAHVVQPLLEHGLRELSATILQPASMLRQTALEELMDQARDLMSFRGVESTEALPSQAAFNLYPTPAARRSPRSTLSALWKDGPRVRTQLIQAGVFHCMSASIELRFGSAVDSAEIREALEAHPHVTWWKDEDEPLSPVRGASFDDVLVTAPDSPPEASDVHWLWVVMDNLTRGAALNALAIAEQMGKVN